MNQAVGMTLYERLSLLKGVLSKILTKRYKSIWCKEMGGKEKNVQEQRLCIDKGGDVEPVGNDRGKAEARYSNPGRNSSKGNIHGLAGISDSSTWD